MSQIVGEPEAVEALRTLATEKREYLKYLLTEAKTSTDHRVAFTAKDGARFELRLHPDGKMEVVRSPT